jgi:polyphenol oxidase
VELEPVLTARTVGGVGTLVDEQARSDGLLVGFTNRLGGVSHAPFDSLNLAAGVGDEPAAVAENRRRAAAAMGFNAGLLTLAKQVHGTSLVEVRPGGARFLGNADGLVVRQPGAVLGILTADCAPVVVAGRRGIALLHAGWRGLSAGIIEWGVRAVEPATAAWVGPSVRECCYEVGADVIEAFRSRGLPVTGRHRVDPGLAASFELHRLGVARIAASVGCTSCDSSYFSYRRDGVTGRHGAFCGMLAGTQRGPE